ncbi:hypothetical protein SAMN05192561_101201 [Halopenitus malekzadehii]|uniref:Uncharacterized protein n=1 Tax=Halopenitus malekzadehii TaxID=1267564 RepID=A0A1H6HNT4_9EURY|nr:UPF0146 family protein [Halopenitus malekzadehii]SEH37497.1 hypothetical protein SAMN05192561_101201 [Halopenitus malekzadehii]
MTRSDAPPIVAAVAEVLASERPRAAGWTTVEVGIGRRPEAARALVDAGHDVIAIDVTERDVPTDVTFYRADVHDLADGTATLASDVGNGGSGPPSFPVIDAVYARNLPAEIQPATARFASRVDAPLAFTTLGFESPSPALPPSIERRAIGTETVFVLPD